MNRIQFKLGIVLVSASLLLVTPAILLAGGGGDGGGCSARVTCKLYCENFNGMWVIDYGVVGSRDVDGTKRDGTCVADYGHNGVDLCVQSYVNENRKKQCLDITATHKLVMVGEWKNSFGDMSKGYEFVILRERDR